MSDGGFEIMRMSINGRQAQCLARLWWAYPDEWKKLLGGFWKYGAQGGAVIDELGQDVVAVLVAMESTHGRDWLRWFKMKALIGVLGDDRSRDALRVLTGMAVPRFIEDVEPEPVALAELVFKAIQQEEVGFEDDEEPLSNRG